MNIQEALAAVRANPPHSASPLPWANDDEGALYCRSGYQLGRAKGHARHIRAAVNAAPVLAAEVERLQGEVEAERQAGITLGSALFEKLDFLQGQLAAYRLAVEALPELHPERCANGHQCHCGAVKANKARTEARRAVGLEGSHG